MMAMKKSVVLLWVLALGLPVLAGLAQDKQKDRIVIGPAHPDDLLRPARAQGGDSRI